MENDYNKRYKYLGTNDHKNECNLCGKKDLKKVIWLEDTEEDFISHYGVSCGAKLKAQSTKEFREWMKEEQIKSDKEKCKELFLQNTDKTKQSGKVYYNYTNEKTIITELENSNIKLSFFNKYLKENVRTDFIKCFNIKK